MIKDANYFLGEDVEGIPSSNAYWISPTGKLIAVDQTHILKVLESPDKFGFDMEYIKNIHDKHNEPLGAEGNARESIMADMMANGWIRVRYVPKQGSWTIQLVANDILTIPKRVIADFLWGLMELNPKNKFSGLKIINTYGNELYAGDIDDALNADNPVVEAVRDCRLLKVADVSTCLYSELNNNP
jgi:hypothetical protein